MEPVAEAVREHLEVAARVESLAPQIHAAAEISIAALHNGGRLLFCGNGGSASDANHLAAELAGRFLRERRAYDALALPTNVATLTAVGNDYGYDEVFRRQVEAYGRPGDVLFAITTSGNSPNVLAAAREARSLGLKVVGLTGESGGALAASCDVLLAVPSRTTARIQEAHILMGHILCGLIEDALA